jgi:hypothetical protein
MGEHGAICRLGVFYDGSFFSYAQNYYYHERQLGWLRFPELHHFLENYIGLREQGFASYKVVYAAVNLSLFKVLARWDFLSYPESYPRQSRAAMGSLGIGWPRMSMHSGSPLRKY